MCIGSFTYTQSRLVSIVSLDPNSSVNTNVTSPFPPSTRVRYITETFCVVLRNGAIVSKTVCKHFEKNCKYAFLKAHFSNVVTLVTS